MNWSYVTLNLFGMVILTITIVFCLILSVNIFLTVIKKKPFPKKILFATITGVIMVLTIYSYNHFFFTFNHIDKKFAQKGPGPLTSPTKEYTANAFYETYGGAAGGVNVWVEITYNDEKKESQIVYYSDAKSRFSMKWINQDTLYILNDNPNYPNSNRSIELEIDKEIYHENGLACKSLLMKGEYESCYQN